MGNLDGAILALAGISGNDPRSSTPQNAVVNRKKSHNQMIDSFLVGSKPPRMIEFLWNASATYMVYPT